jgi:hypothetical protein
MQKLLVILVPLLLATRLEAQLPVNREPHHKVILENSYLRLLEGNIPVNDTTAAHQHAANSVVIFLSHSTFGIQVIGDKPVITTVNTGDMKYVAYGDKPVVHIVWNQTPTPLHFFVVELAKHPATRDSCPILSHPGITLQWRHPSVRAYYLDTDNNQPRHLEPASCARLLIDITGTISSGGEKLSSDYYKFFPPKNPIDLNGSARCILLEIN